MARRSNVLCTKKGTIAGQTVTITVLKPGRHRPSLELHQAGRIKNQRVDCRPAPEVTNPDDESLADVTWVDNLTEDEYHFDLWGDLGADEMDRWLDDDGESEDDRGLDYELDYTDPVITAATLNGRTARDSEIDAMLDSSALEGTYIKVACDHDVEVDGGETVISGRRLAGAKYRWSVDDDDSRRTTHPDPLWIRLRRRGGRIADHLEVPAPYDRDETLDLVREDLEETWESDDDDLEVAYPGCSCSECRRLAPDDPYRSDYFYLSDHFGPDDDEDDFGEPIDELCELEGQLLAEEEPEEIELVFLPSGCTVNGQVVYQTNPNAFYRPLRLEGTVAPGYASTDDEVLPRRLAETGTPSPYAADPQASPRGLHSRRLYRRFLQKFA